MKKKKVIDLISVRGRMRCGKDEVGSMIQYLTSIHGKEGTRTYKEAKSMVYADGYAVKDFHRYTTEWQIRKYASPLKDMLCILLGCSKSQLENDNFKNTPVGEEWWYYQGSDFGDGPPKIFPYNTPHEANKKLELIKPTPRMMLQRFGTDLLREQFHPNVWVNTTFAQIEEGDKVVITDTRFTNEAKMVKERGGITINVIRPFALRYPEYAEYADGFDFKRDELYDDEIDMYRKLNHLSETDLDGATFDFTINNDGTLDDLLDKVKSILTIEKII